MHYPWLKLLHWQPFRIDALGLVTLLGAEQIDASVGRLVRSKYLEFMPLLGAFVISGDRFREKAAGFNLYNISQGIHTTDLSAWLTRWMLAQDFEKTRSVVRWSIVDPSENAKSRSLGFFISLIVGVIFNGVLIALTVLSKDGWGLANALSMDFSIFVRWYIIRANCKNIDVAVEDAEEPSGVKCSDAKTLVIMSDSKAVTMTLPVKLIARVFCVNLDPLQPGRYHLVRWIGWVAFAVHIITIGMADLVTQLYTVVLIVLPTILTISKFGCDDSDWKPRIMSVLGLPLQCKSYLDEAGAAPVIKTCYIGSRLKAEIYEWPLSYDPAYDKNSGKLKDKEGNPSENVKRSERRRDLYAWLQLTYDEELSMDKWDLFPHTRDDNHEWFKAYSSKAKNLHPIPGVALYERGRTLAIDDPRSPWNPINRRGSSFICQQKEACSPIASDPAPIPLTLTPSIPENSAFPAGRPVIHITIPSRVNTWPPLDPEPC